MNKDLKSYLEDSDLDVAPKNNKPVKKKVINSVKIFEEYQRKKMLKQKPKSKLGMRTIEMKVKIDNDDDEKANASVAKY